MFERVLNTPLHWVLFIFEVVVNTRISFYARPPNMKSNIESEKYSTYFYYYTTKNVK